MKIVINNRYGGFGLSQTAVEKLAELGNEKAIETMNLYKLGKISQEEICYRLNSIKRHDKNLIKVIKDLGEKANGYCSNLEIVDINVGYNISEYGGKEFVEEKYFDYLIEE
jgi:hypothetical protein